MDEFISPNVKMWHRVDIQGGTGKSESYIAYVNIWGSYGSVGVDAWERVCRERIKIICNFADIKYCLWHHSWGI